ELEGGLGNDSINGGDGADTVVGTMVTTGGSIVLTDSLMTGLGTDTIVSIEKARLTGSTGNDTIDSHNFSGQASLDGGGGGIDSLIAHTSGGTSTVSFVSYTTGITVELGVVGFQTVDTLGSQVSLSGAIVNVTGSSFNDTLMGNSSANLMFGGPGTDVM